MRPRTAAVVLAAGVVLLALAGCSSSKAGSAAVPVTATPSPSSSPRPSPDLGDCAPAFLTTVTAGKLTVGVPIGSDAPYLAVEKNSKARVGAEADVIYAIAEALGFRRTAVVWEEVEVDPAAVAVPDTVDLIIGQLPIPLPGVALASFTAPYLDVPTVLVARADAAPAQARRIGDLLGLRVGAWPGDGPAASAAAAQLRPKEPITALAARDRAIASLDRGTVDVVAVDLVNAGRMVARSDGDLVIVGRLPAGVDDATLGLALAPGNPLAACVDHALGEVVAAGTVEQAVMRGLGDGAWRALAS